MEFQIRRSINNVYSSVSLENGREYELRIKGKILKGEREYNPVAVGDIALGEPYSDNQALITEIKERRSWFKRWNIKAGLNQTIASNQDQTAIVLSAFSPPFRPRFVDRAIASSHNAEILLIMNKSDYGLTEDEFARWALYHKLGYRLIAVSSVNGEGIDELRALLKGKVTAFVGQSGVGKSTLINTLLGTNQVTGEVSLKFNRGRHTTNHAIYLEGDDLAIIDTPGVREINVPIESLEEVKASFPELINTECQFSSCLHRGELGCAVPSLIERGEIDPDRYESYLRIAQAIEEREPLYMRTKRSNGR